MYKCEWTFHEKQYPLMNIKANVYKNVFIVNRETLFQIGCDARYQQLCSNREDVNSVDHVHTRVRIVIC